MQKYEVRAVSSTSVNACAVALAGGKREQISSATKCHSENEVFAKSDSTANANSVKVRIVCSTDGNSSLKPNMTSIA